MRDTNDLHGNRIVCFTICLRGMRVPGVQFAIENEGGKKLDDVEDYEEQKQHIIDMLRWVTPLCSGG